MKKQPENKVLGYIEDIIYFKKHEDKEGMEALTQEGKYIHVTLDEVGRALLEVIDDITTFVDLSQAIQEVRLKAIVETLDTDLQEKIKQKFMEAGDDLFVAAEGEQII